MNHKEGQQQTYYPTPPLHQPCPPESNPSLPQSQQYLPYTLPPPTYKPGQDVYESPKQAYQSPPTLPSKPNNYNIQSKCNDVFFAILFVVHLFIFAVLSYFGIAAAVENGVFSHGLLRNGIFIGRLAVENAISSDRSADSGASYNIMDAGLIIVLFILTVTGFMISFFYMLLAQKFPRFFIEFNLLFSILVSIGVTIFYFIVRHFAIAIPSALFTIYIILLCLLGRKRISFSVVMLKAVITIMRNYYGTVIVAISGLLIIVAYNFWWILTTIGLHHWLSTVTIQSNGIPHTTSDERLVVAMQSDKIVFSTVIQGVIHVTISGAFASYYFLYGTPTAPSKPIIGSLKRALATSFGSACFGGLLIVIMKILSRLISLIEHILRKEFGGTLTFVEYLRTLAEEILKRYNFYAYTQCAIYGKSFLQAAEDTWTIIEDRGIEQIINENIIENLVGISAYLVGVITGILGYIYLMIVRPPFNGGLANGPYTFFILSISFVLGMQMMYIFGTVILSGNTTTFVALAEDPEALARTKPELFEELRQTWPHVVQGVPHEKNGSEYYSLLKPSVCDGLREMGKAKSAVHASG
ncbi:uncharacterized protein VTP21DRAFT_7458 [Calcarisporiella thermophila]|uniref:uncharacterized protein n=1 Tax=Calcarisporiella thermophila TaxID=911321 RepID=UPI0037428C30